MIFTQYKRKKIMNSLKIMIKIFLTMIIEEVINTIILY